MAEFFHQEATIKFCIDNEDYECDNTQNKSAIFCPNNSTNANDKTSDFIALSSILEKVSEFNQVVESSISSIDSIRTSKKVFVTNLGPINMETIKH